MSPAGSINSSVNEMSKWLITWLNDGKYIPYSNDELMDVLIHAKSIIPNYIRISRIFLS